MVAIPVSANATLLPQGRFFCRAETMVICDNDGNCSKDTSRLSTYVDFANGTVSNLSMENKPKPLLRVEAQGDIILFSSYVGNVFTITKKATDIGPTYGFKAMIYLGTPIVHFGTCNRA